MILAVAHTRVLSHRTRSDRKVESNNHIKTLTSKELDGGYMIMTNSVDIIYDILHCI